MGHELGATAHTELHCLLARARSVIGDAALTDGEVDALLDVGTGTYAALHVLSPPAHPVERRLRLLLDVLVYARSLLGGAGGLQEWLRTSHPVMSGLTPVGFLSANPERLREMRDALQAEYWSGRGAAAQEVDLGGRRDRS